MEKDATIQTVEKRSIVIGFDFNVSADGISL